MSRRVFLSRGSGVTDAIAPPTVDAMRARLGGRARGGPSAFRAGAIVQVATAGGGAREGVVLCADALAVDVLFERGVVKRAAPSGVSLCVAPAARALLDVAAQAELFGGLREGDAVEVLRGEGPPTRGVLREKCRYGGLVALDPQTLLGVGFQRLRPTAVSAASAPRERSQS